jgi:hypothetical protein
MAQKNEKKKVSSSKQQSNAISNIYIALAALAIVVVAFAIFLYIRQVNQTALNSSMSSFKTNFFAAKHVGIYVAYPNSTLFAGSEACATKIIEVIAENKTNHMAPSNISFYVLNSTACTYVNSLVNTSGKAVNASASFCVNQSKTNPSIFINYSATNGTIVTPTKLVFQGDFTYLYQCPIAYELT